MPLAPSHRPSIFLTFFFSASLSEHFALTGGREGPRQGEKSRIPVGEVVHVFPRRGVMHLCGLVDRGAKGWGADYACLSSKTAYMQDAKHQASFSSGLPDLAKLVRSYEEERDGFVIAKLLEWQAHELWPCVEVTHALCELPREHQMFIYLAVAHGHDIPRPFASHIQDMFPFEPQELHDSATASRITLDPNDEGRVDLRHCPVFTIDADVTVDLDDAMHCCRHDDGSYEVCKVQLPSLLPLCF